jgi:hypothetical protein
MTDQESPRRPPTPLGFVDEMRKVRREQIAPGQLEPTLALLRAWQSRRLARTYADLLASPRYGPAFQFFLDEIYGPKDFSQRDHDLLQMYGVVRRLVPEALLEPATVIVKLHELTERLDNRLLEALITELHVGEHIKIADYAEGYRRCHNYADRLRQIDWIHQVAITLNDVAGPRLTGTTLALAHGPAKAAGWGDLWAFLDKGYRAFRPMKGAEEFAGTIRSRETTALDRMLAGEPDPFGFGPDVAEP